MAEFPPDIVEVKIESLDNECHPNEHPVVHLDDDCLEEDPQQREKDAELKQLKEELSHTHQIISEQSLELERANKKITEQEELLMRTEAEQSTCKAVAEAEINTLRNLLEEERKRRIVAEQTSKEFLGPRRNFLSTWNKLSLCNVSTSALPSFSSRFSRLSNGNIKGAFPFPQPSVGVVREDYSADSDKDDVVVLNVVENYTNNAAFTSKVSQTNEKSQNTQTMKKTHTQNVAKKNAMYPCHTCGATFNAGWKLISHVKCHRVKDTFGKTNGSSLMVRSTWRPIASQSHQRQKSVYKATNDLSRNVAQDGSSFSAPPPKDAKMRDKKFTCKLCEHRFAIVSQLKMHMKQAHGIMDDTFAIGCKDCGIIFSTRKQHVRHRRIVHGTRYHEVGQRKELSQENSALSSEALTQPSTMAQTSNIPLVCSSKSGTTARRRRRQFKHEIGPLKMRSGYYCTCGRSFRTLTILKEHIRHNVKERKHICDMCGQIFTGLLNLKLHNFHFHQRSCTVTKIISAATETSVDISSLSSNLEGNSTTEGDDGQGAPPVQQHTLVGPDPMVQIAKYSCSCGREYSCRASFMTHSRSKNTGKIFQCSLCTKRFDLHGNLKHHVRQAHKVTYSMGRYACGNCAQTFESSTLLVRHRFYLCKYRSKKHNDKDSKARS